MTQSAQAKTDAPVQNGGGIQGRIQVDAAAQGQSHGSTLLGLTLVALGIVYGDIGTSPLYAFQVALAGTGHAVPTQNDILGVLGLIIYALWGIISLKYLIFILNADNEGEGGILALMSLVKANKYSRGVRLPALVGLGVLGAALLFGNGIITPAISVLSAMEGLKVIAPHFAPLVIPFTLAIIVGLFALQARGTGTIGKLFGPVMVLWFTTLAVMGVWQISQAPQVLLAFNPIYAIRLIVGDPAVGFAVCAAVFLAVTGGEALYADMGHVGATAIRRAWFGLVLPALMLNYLGQGALAITSPGLADNTFFKSAPAWALWPLVILAVFATIIASQALISGVFSLTRQAIQMGLMPRMRIIQTAASRECRGIARRLASAHGSAEDVGQIYVPTANWLLMIATLAVVVSFRSSDALAAAYGIAVSLTMLITSILLYRVMAEKWKWPLWVATSVSIAFATVDCFFLIANSLKILEGGWLPLAIGAALTYIMMAWRNGSTHLRNVVKEMSTPLDKLFDTMEDEQPVVRVPGWAVWLTSTTDGLPPALTHYLVHNKALHEHVILMTVETTRKPFVTDHDWLHIEELGHGFWRILLRTGFMQQPDIEIALRGCAMRGVPIDRNDVHYFIGHETLVRKHHGSPLDVSTWLVFSMLSRVAGKVSDFFHVPHEKITEVGLRIEV